MKSSGETCPSPSTQEVVNVTRAPWQVTSHHRDTLCASVMVQLPDLIHKLDQTHLMRYCLMVCITSIWEAGVRESVFLIPGWFVLPEFRSVWISVAWNISELQKAILKSSKMQIYIYTNIVWLPFNLCLFCFDFFFFFRLRKQIHCTEARQPLLKMWLTRTKISIKGPWLQISISTSDTTNLVLLAGNLKHLFLISWLCDICLRVAVI